VTKTYEFTARDDPGAPCSSVGIMLNDLEFEVLYRCLTVAVEAGEPSDLLPEAQILYDHMSDMKDKMETTQ